MKTSQNIKKLFLLFIPLFFLQVEWAKAEILYGWRSGAWNNISGGLYLVDTMTGGETLVCPSPAYASGHYGSTINYANQLFFAGYYNTNDEACYLTTINLHNRTSHITPITRAGYDGIEYDETSGLLYGWRSGTWENIKGGLYTIDPDTGVESLVYYSPEDSIGCYGFTLDSLNQRFYVGYLKQNDDTIYLATIDIRNGFTAEAPLVRCGYDRMEFDSQTDNLYGWRSGVWENLQGGLFSIDTITGEETLISPTPEGASGCYGTVFDSADQRFYGSYYNSNDDTIYLTTLDLLSESDTATPLLRCGYDGLHLIPEPGSLLLLSAGVALLRRRRTKRVL